MFVINGEAVRTIDDAGWYDNINDNKTSEILIIFIVAYIVGGWNYQSRSVISNEFSKKLLKLLRNENFNIWAIFWRGCNVYNIVVGGGKTINSYFEKITTYYQWV